MKRDIEGSREQTTVSRLRLADRCFSSAPWGGWVQEIR